VNALDDVEREIRRAMNGAPQLRNVAVRIGQGASTFSVSVENICL